MKTPILYITNSCIQCDSCAIICPEDSVIKHNNSYKIDTWSCTLCQLCKEICPANSIFYKLIP